jgi:hypothetical protein
MGQWDPLDLGNGEHGWTDGSGYSDDLHVWAEDDGTYNLQVWPSQEPVTLIPLEATDWRDALNEASVIAHDIMCNYEHDDPEMDQYRPGPKMQM